jgi:predicted NBD/HSP70 family sugar kinase
MEQNEKDGHLEMIAAAETAALHAIARIQADTDIDMETVAEYICAAFEQAREKLEG